MAAAVVLVLQGKGSKFMMSISINMGKSPVRKMIFGFVMGASIILGSSLLSTKYGHTFIPWGTDGLSFWDFSPLGVYNFTVIWGALVLFLSFEKKDYSQPPKPKTISHILLIVFDVFLSLVIIALTFWFVDFILSGVVNFDKFFFKGSHKITIELIMQLFYGAITLFCIQILRNRPA